MCLAPGLDTARCQTLVLCQCLVLFTFVASAQDKPVERYAEAISAAQRMGILTTSSFVDVAISALPKQHRIAAPVWVIKDLSAFLAQLTQRRDRQSRIKQELQKQLVFYFDGQPPLLVNGESPKFRQLVLYGAKSNPDLVAVFAGALVFGDCMVIGEHRESTCFARQLDLLRDLRSIGFFVGQQSHIDEITALWRRAVRVEGRRSTTPSNERGFK